MHETFRNERFGLRSPSFYHCQRLDAKAGVTRSLGRQLLRSGTSIGANVEEAQAAQSSADFVSKCSIALKKARETLYWLRLLDAGDHLANEDGKLLRQEADELSRLIGATIVRTKNSEVKIKNEKMQSVGDNF